MKALKLTNTPDALRVARCLCESPSIEKLCGKSKLVAVIGSRINGYDRSDCFLIDCTNGSMSYRNEIILPVETLKFCPFAAMREGISVLSEGDTVGKLEEYRNGNFGVLVESNWSDRFEPFYQLSIDLEAAEKLDGVSLVEI